MRIIDDAYIRWKGQGLEALLRIDVRRDKQVFADAAVLTRDELVGVSYEAIKAARSLSSRCLRSARAASAVARSTLTNLAL